ncbi:MAG: flagellar hook-length control protein FliK [Alcaligenes sp.]
MTSPTLLVIPSAGPAGKDAAVNTGAAAQPGDGAFAVHLQAQQQQVQGGARPTNGDIPADAQAAETDAALPLLITDQDPTALLPTDEADVDAADDAAQSGLPALALSILSEIQALRQGAARSETSLPAAQAEEPTDVRRLPGLTLAAALDADSATVSSPDATSPTPGQDAPLRSALPPAVDAGLTAAVSNAARSQRLAPASAVHSQNAAPRAGAKSEPAPQAVSVFSTIPEPRLNAEAPSAPNEQAAAPRIAAQPLSVPAAPASMSASTTPVAQASIPTPLQSPDWSAALGRQFIALAQQSQGQIQSADIRLDPPELGPLRITLHIQDGVAHAMITSPHAQVRHTIEQSLQQLQQQFADGGLTLGQADVGDQHASHQQFQEQLAARHQASSGSAFSLDGHAEADAAAAPAAPPARLLDANALVDTFA